MKEVNIKSASSRERIIKDLQFLEICVKSGDNMIGQLWKLHLVIENGIELGEQSGEIMKTDCCLFQSVIVTA